MDSSSRLRILISLYDVPRGFQDIKDVAGLEKSALSSHLKLLMDADLVEKYQHGVYRITVTGRELLEALEAVHDGISERRHEAQQGAIRRQITESFLKRARR